MRDWFQPTLSPGQLAGGGAQPTSLDEVIRRGNELRPPATPEPPPRGANVAPPPNLGPSPTAGLGPRDEHANPFTPIAAAAGSTGATGTGGSTTAGTSTSAGTSGTATPQSPTAGMSVPAVTAPPPTAQGVPAGASPTGAGAITAAASSLSTPVVSFKLKFIKQEELKTLTLQYNVQEATQRTYAPQGFFGLLLADLTKENHFVEIDLDDPFFRVFSVSAEAPVDFTRIGLQSLQVSLDYGDPNNATDHKHGDFVFDSINKEPQKFEVFMNKSYDTAYRCQVQYHFDPLSEWEGTEFSYEIPEKVSEDRTLLLNPFNDIGFLEIKIRPHKIDAGIVDSTDVILEYDDGDLAIKEKTVMVLPDSTEQFWKLRIKNSANRTFSYRLIHHLKDRTTREMPLVTTRATTIFVNDPFQDALDLQLIPSYSPAVVKQAFIDVEYNDVENGYNRNERIAMPGTNMDIVPLRISIIDGEKKSFSYRITVVGSDGSIHQNPLVETDNQYIQVA